MPTPVSPVRRRLLATTLVASSTSHVVLDFRALADGAGGTVAIDPTVRRIRIFQVFHIFSSGTGTTHLPRLATDQQSNIRPLAAAAAAKGTNIYLFEVDSFVAELKAADQTLDWYAITDSAVADGHCTIILYFEECRPDGT